MNKENVKANLPIDRDYITKNGTRFTFKGIPESQEKVRKTVLGQSFKGSRDFLRSSK